MLHFIKILYTETGTYKKPLIEGVSRSDFGLPDQDSVGAP